MEKATYLKQAGPTQHKSNSTDISDKEYTEFAELAVHDLDAPLRKLSVLIDMLTGKVLTDKDAQSHIERIGKCIGDMRSLIDDLAIWTRIQRDGRELTPCVIEDIIQQALEDMPPAIKNKQAVITTYSLPIIDGDADHFLRLFYVLLENAIEYSKKDVVSEIQIHSSVLTTKEKQNWHLDEERNYYKIEISDNGIGIKEEYAEKIFNPFVRLHGKSQYPGTGIGLAICRKIVEVHDGIIYAEGQENEGAKFVLILPESR
jgi:light-regulated signal transduction histidine kinase (bacteriophytochrome)